MAVIEADLQLLRVGAVGVSIVIDETLAEFAMNRCALAPVLRVESADAARKDSTEVAMVVGKQHPNAFAGRANSSGRASRRPAHNDQVKFGISHVEPLPQSMTSTNEPGSRAQK